MKNIYLLPITLFLVIFSCKKEEITIPYNCTDNIIDAAISNNTINNTIDLNSLNPQITGENGTNIAFSSNSFLDQNGNVVSGNIDIELVDAQDNKDMLLMDCPTVTTGGDLLESAGILYFNPTQEGNQLTINPNNPPIVTLPSSSGDLMDYYTGILDSDGNLSGWELVPNNTIQTFSDITGGDTSYFYTFSLTGVGWINADYPYGIAPFSTVTVDLPDGYNNSNSSVFIYFRDVNSCITAYDNDNNGSFDSPCTISESEVVQFVAVSQIEGVRKYFVTEPTSISSISHLEVILKDDMQIALCDDGLRLLIKESLE
tara:strand:- start:1011 stop:1955 length:945 start_codon:yes stop_codon:yes gene_type:complete